MLDGSEHLSWSDKELERRLYELLGRSGGVCVITNEMIEWRLLEKCKALGLQSTRLLGVNVRLLGPMVL